MRPLKDPRRVARRRLAAVARHVPLALGGSSGGVHQARVASRRLREFLPLLGVTPETSRSLRTCRRRARSLTRALGPVRELDVALMNLDEVAGAGLPGSEAASVVRVALVAEREGAVDRMLSGLSTIDLDKLTRRVLAVADENVDPEARSAIGPRLAERLRDRGRALRSAIDDAGIIYAPDRLHRIRIALKKFRYGLELAQDFGWFRLRGSLARLKALQDLLGELHDFEVLATRVRDCGADACDPAAQDALTALARHLDEEIRRRHSEFLSARTTLTVVFHWARWAQMQLGGPDAGTIVNPPVGGAGTSPDPIDSAS